MANKQRPPFSKQLKAAFPGFPIKALLKPEAPDLRKVQEYLLTRVAHEDLASFTAAMLQGLLTMESILKTSADKPTANKPTVKSMPPEEPFENLLFERIERERSFALKNVARVVSGVECRTSDVIRSELDAVDREYREVANSWLNADDRLETEADEAEAVKRFQESRRALTPLIKKRAHLTEELGAAEIRELVAMKEQKRMSEQGRHAANASHAKHHNDERKAREWYAEHKTTMSKDAAATRIRKDEIVHASWRTIRKYLTNQ